MAQRLTLDDWPPGRTSRSHRIHAAYLRAARRAGVTPAAYVRLAGVAERDGWTCTACTRPVPAIWAAASVGQAPALAFAKAWADGGAYNRDNARLVHYGCMTIADRSLRNQLAAILTGDMSARQHATGTDDACANGHELAGANLLSSPEAAFPGNKRLTSGFSPIFSRN